MLQKIYINKIDAMVTTKYFLVVLTKEKRNNIKPFSEKEKYKNIHLNIIVHY